MQHELGHALGIGHIVAARVVDVMGYGWARTGQGVALSQCDLDAVGAAFGWARRARRPTCPRSRPSGAVDLRLVWRRARRRRCPRPRRAAGVLGGAGGAGRCREPVVVLHEPGAGHADHTRTEPDPQPGVAPGDLRVATALAAVRRLAGDAWAAARHQSRFRQGGRAGWRAEPRAMPGLRRRGWSGSPCPAATRGACRWRLGARSTWWRARSTSIRGAVPAGRRAPRHRAAGAGAEDNASGVGVLLEVARRSSAPHRDCPWCSWPSVPRSRVAPPTTTTTTARGHYVATMTRPSAVILRAGWSRWTASASATSCRSARSGSGYAARAVSLRAGPAAPACRPCPADNRSSDHWSFARAGCPVARLGGTSYAGYHSPRTSRPSWTPPSSTARAGHLGLAARPLNRQKFANSRHRRGAPAPRAARSRRRSGRA